VAVDEGLRDTYLRSLRKQIEERRQELGKAREMLRCAQIEDQAQELLTPADLQVLIDAGILDSTPVTEARDRRDKLVAEVQALQNLMDAVRGLT
jgi:hypothetical protein